MGGAPHEVGEVVMRLRLSVVLGTLMVSLSGSVAAVAAPVGGDVRVSGMNAISHESSPSVAYNPAANQYLVVWQDLRNSRTRVSDIFGRLVGPDGKPVGGDFRISGKNATDGTAAPAVAYNSTANEYLVVWGDERNTTTRGTDIFGRRVAADGTRVGGDFRISGAMATSYEYNPAVAYNPTTNRYLVVWFDGRNMVTRSWDIYGRQVAANGARVGGDFRISGAMATSSASDPAVECNPVAGQFLVAWRDGRDMASRGADIYGRRVGAGGMPLGGDFRISGAMATSDEHSPAVAFNPVTNQHLVVWHDERNEATRGADIYGRQVAANGARVGGDFRISGENATNWESAAAVAYGSAANSYLVAWQDGRNGDTRGTDIYGRRVAANGKLLGGDFRISGKNATSEEYSPAVAYNPVTSQHLAVWQDWRNSATRGRDIYGRRVAG